MDDVKTTCAIFFHIDLSKKRGQHSTKSAINKLNTLFKIIWIGQVHFVKSSKQQIDAMITEGCVRLSKYVSV